MPVIGPALGQLETTGFLRLAALQPELEYLFRHALIQDAAYASLLKADRRRLHLEVAQTIERLYAERSDELAAVLAHHFALAGEATQALAYYLRAGEFALQRCANAEASAMYAQALELSVRLPVADVSVEALRTAHLQGGRALELLGRRAEARVLYERLQASASARGEQALVLAALLAQATIYLTFSVEYDLAQGEALCQRALVLAHALHDQAAAARLLWNLQLMYRATGRWVEAIEAGEKSIAIARVHGTTEQLAYSLNDTGLCYTLSGLKSYRVGMQYLDQAREIWRTLNNQPMLTDNLTSSGACCYLAGETLRSYALASEAHAISQVIGNAWGVAFSSWILSYSLWDQGDLVEAERVLTAGIAEGQRVGFMMSLVAGNASLVALYLACGWLDAAERCARVALEIGEQSLSNRKTFGSVALARVALAREAWELALDAAERAYRDASDGDMFSQMALQLTLAEARWRVGRADEAEAGLLDWLKYTASLDAHAFEADAHLLLGQMRSARGAWDAAEQALAEAARIAEARPVRHLAWRIALVQAEVAQARGDAPDIPDTAGDAAAGWAPARAAERRGQARAALRDLCARISPGPMRDAFCAQAQVQAVLADDAEVTRA